MAAELEADAMPRFVRTNISQCSWNLTLVGGLPVLICGGFLYLVARSPSPVPKSSGEWFAFALVLSLGAFGIFNVIRGVSRIVDHTKHPFWKRLENWGPPENVEREIDHAIHASSPAWYFKPGLFCPSACRLNDLVWVHLVRTKHSVNLVPVGTSYSVSLYDRHGQSFTVDRTRNDDRHELEQYTAQAPWAVVGYSEETENRWNRDRSTLIAEVDARRRANGS